MRIEQIDLKMVRLPLVRPFQTSSSRKDHLDHILVRVDAGGVVGLGRVRQPVRPVLLSRDDRDVLAHPSSDFLAPLVLGREWSDIDELVGLLPPVKGNKFRPGGAGDGLLGRAGAIAGPAAARRCSAARGPRFSRG